MEENLDKAVEDELEREKRAAEEDEYGEEEKSYPSDGRRNYRGRGGGRFGGDREPPAKEKDEGGYFGSKLGRKKPKGEFEGSDEDDDIPSFKSAYDKPSRGGGQVAGRGGKGGKGGRKAMAMNESDFPSL